MQHIKYSARYRFLKKHYRRFLYSEHEVRHTPSRDAHRQNTAGWSQSLVLILACHQNTELLWVCYLTCLNVIFPVCYQKDTDVNTSKVLKMLHQSRKRVEKHIGLKRNDIFLFMDQTRKLKNTFPNLRKMVCVSILLSLTPPKMWN